jgi:hypothetical protein
MPQVLDLKNLGMDSETQNIRRGALSRVLQELVILPTSDEDVDDGRGPRPLRLNVMSRRPHSAVLVTARRGDGKTTFLTHLLRVIEAGRQSYTEELLDPVPARVADLYSLGIIDPTLIESKQNIVVMIVDRIRDAVDRAAKSDVGRAGAHEDVKRELRKLASGLTLLDGIGSEDLYGRDWADPDYVLQQGLDRARAADEFERSLYAYISKACQFLRTDAFVIAIDDVDTAFDRGWPVLEALRKFLATDRLRVVLSGDIGLYSMLVRREQWRQVTPEFLKAEALLPPKYKRTDRLARLIEELQDQYLVKIVPTERRVELQPLNEMIAGGDLVFGFDEDNWNPRPFTRMMAKAVVRASLPADQDAFAEAIFRMPLRSAVRVLQGGARALRYSPMSEPGDDVYFVLRQVLSSVLLSRDMDAAALIDPDPRRVMHVLANWLTEHRRWGSGARFTAGTGEEDYDLVAIFAAATLVRMFQKRTSAMLEFGIRVCAIREKVEREGLDESVTRELVLHLWPTALEGTTRFASRLAAWDLGRAGVAAGSVHRAIRLSSFPIAVTSVNWESAFQRLYGMTSTRIGGDFTPLDRERFASALVGEDERAKSRLLDALPRPMRIFHEQLSGQDPLAYKIGNDPFYVYANSLETLRTGLKSGASAILMLGVCRIASGRRTETGIFSVLRLIATVVELAGIGEIGLSGEDRSTAIENLLNEAELFRSYPAVGRNEANSEGGGPSGLDELDDDAPDTAEPSRSPIGRNRRQTFASMVDSWIDKEPGSGAVMSPQTISRVWTRFTYAFDGIRADLVEGRTLYLGVLVHRTIIAFLHAVGVEALRTTSRRIGTIAYRNPIGSAQPFHRLLGTIYAEEDAAILETPEVAFFDHVFSCPLWGYFLARSDGDVSAPAKVDYIARIISTYFDRMNVGRSASGNGSGRNGTIASRIDERNYMVTYARPVSERRGAQFTGLYPLLNTVPLLGGADRPGRPNAEMASVAGLTPVRRVRRPSSGGEPSGS